MSTARHRTFGFAMGVLLHGLALGQTWIPVEGKELSGRLAESRARSDAMGRYKQEAELLAYRDQRDREPSERATTVMWRAGQRIKAEHLGVITVQDAEVRVILDPEEGVIILGDPRQDLEHFLDDSYRDQVLAAAVSIGRAQGADGNVRYRVKFPSGGEMDIVEFVFDRKGWLRTVDTWLARPVVLDPDNPLSAVVRPRVVLNVGVPEPLDKGHIVPAPSSVVSLVGQVRGLGEWKDMEIIDNRIAP